MAGISWTSESGKLVEIEALGKGHFAVTFGGAELGRGDLRTRPSDIPDALYSTGIRGIIRVGRNVIGLTAERRDALLAQDAHVTTAAAVADPLASARAELARLESAVANARYRVTTRNERDGGVNPATLYAASAKAEADLSAWIAAHQADYETIRAERAAERAAEAAVSYRIYGGERIARGED